jgi:hypothetical protein
MTNSPGNPPPKVFGFNLDFVTSLAVILGSSMAYVLHNQVTLEKRLTTVEVKADNHSKTYDSLQDSIDKLDGKIDKLIEKTGRMQ